MSNSNQVKTRQAIYFALLVFGVSAVAGLISYYTVYDANVPEKHSKTILPIDKSDPQELWMMRFESEKQIADQRMQLLENLVLETKKQEPEKEKENRSLREEISKFKKELQKMAAENASVIKNGQDSYRDAPFGEIGNEKSGIPQAKVLLSEMIVSDPPKKLQHVDQTIPAGTSVKAILISSVDMPCGVASSTDPQPIKLRLVDDGRLPKKVRARLKGGILIASAYGDLSNERIYIRLERLTQVRPDGNFIETSVAGYVTGEDGKYGIKGIVVDKSYKMVENAAISGFFSGVNQYLQATASRVNNLHEPGYTVNTGDIATVGGYASANTAFDMLTDYYIKRAEQIRPVIEAAAGRVIDVTFIHHAELGDLHVHDKVKKIRDVNRETF